MPCQRLFEHKQVYRSSVLLGLIITENFSLKFGAKELLSASLSCELEAVFRASPSLYLDHKIIRDYAWCQFILKLLWAFDSLDFPSPPVSFQEGLQNK